MRLARTTTPLPRKSGWQESNLRSPAPKAGGVASSPTARRRSSSTPGGTRTRSFRVEGPASSPLRPRGHKAPAAGLEPALSRVTAARLANSTTPERSGGSRTRTCEAGTALRRSKALPFQLGHASASGRRGSRTPKARRPTRFRDGIPHRWQSFREWPRQASNLHRPVKSRELCRLSYGAAM
jgi:hypothetical protein